ncbi:MAG: hypothetical protein KDC80_09875 [Saprospiraceae bacterium]|nr:hypothetical protein [Saprospiraceae bacterium]
MPLITRKALEYLAEIHDTACTSIYLPTHRSGKEVSEKSDALVLKNEMKAVGKKLEKEGFTELEIDRYLKPVKELVEDSTFWSHQSDGLALFIHKDEMLKFTLPIKFEAFNYVANHFYLKPLMPMFTGDGRFFILALTQDQVEFFEATRYSISDVIIEDLVPAEMEERVGYDYEQKNLQFRTQQSVQDGTIFHGQGAGKQKEKKEILEFFRAVDRGLMKMLHDEDPPMVVVAQDQLFSIYQKVNSYNFLLEKHLSTDPAQMDRLLLHEKSWEIVKPWFNQDRKEDIEFFQQKRDSPLTSTETEDIISAALDGKIKTLFVENRSDIFGIYDQANNKVEIRDNSDAPAVSLMNLAVVETFLKGGNVYLTEEENLPAPYAKMNALYRY